MLRQDFDLELPVSCGELPKDDHGLDIDGIWNNVARTVRDIRGWEVREDVVLSTFSFAKYLMWKDLVDRTDQLKQSPVVKHLIDTPRDPYQSEHEFPNPKTLDANCSPEQVFCPLPADSSQLSAVIGAAKGKDFVLIGPPGTGKSQTIANLIAQCLAEKKTVLFVSEKMAALNVVFRRLDQVGLGDFCLELHSNKARKLDVLNNLKAAWDAKGTVDQDEWLEKAKKLKVLRDQLNRFVKHLHRRRNNGMTAYQAIGRVVVGAEMPKLGLCWPNSDTHSKQELDSLELLVEDLDVNAQQIGEIASSPLSLISQGEWSPSWTQSLLQAVQETIPAAEGIQQTAADFLKAVGIPKFPLHAATRDSLVLLSKILPAAARRDWRFALRPDARNTAEELQRGLEPVAKHGETRAEISTPWDEATIRRVQHGLETISQHRDLVRELSAAYAHNGAALDADQLKTEWETANNSWWPLSWLRRRKVCATLSAAVEGKQELDVSSDLERLITLRRLESKVTDLSDLSDSTSNLWVGFGTKFEEIEEAIRFQVELSGLSSGQSWSADGFGFVAAKRCGVEMASASDDATASRTKPSKLASVGTPNAVWGQCLDASNDVAEETFEYCG